MPPCRHRAPAPRRQTRLSPPRTPRRLGRPRPRLQRLQRLPGFGNLPAPGDVAAPPTTATKTPNGLYATGAPSEAVDPRTISPGVRESRPGDAATRMRRPQDSDRSDCGSDPHPATRHGKSSTVAE
ncbi:hypothetical protein AB0C36_22910 [Streptodolium elevatio]|uniref:Uncharacterized protein n=1 Tax=Streptodolium elevatio TaxID=3157996 RepID=A0ABV3DLK8_9ACTN